MEDSGTVLCVAEDPRQNFSFPGKMENSLTLIWDGRRGALCHTGQEVEQGGLFPFSDEVDIAALLFTESLQLQIRGAAERLKLLY